MAPDEPRGRASASRAAGGSDRVGARCRNCGTFVSQQFARVFGDNEDAVHRCIECSNRSTLRNGEGGDRVPAGASSGP